MRRYTFLLAALLLLCCPLSALALSLDAASVPDNQGDNNLYALAYDYTAGTYHPLDDAGTRYWRDQANVPDPGLVGYRPMIVYGHPTLWGGAYADYIRLEPSAVPQTAWVHLPEDAVLGWDVPAGGTYRIQGQFVLAGDNPSPGVISYSDGINYYIKINNTILVSGYLGKGQSASFDQTVALASSDWVYFGVNAFNEDYFDWGHLKGSITEVSSVPVPASVVLLGTGLTGLLARHRLRRRRD